MEEPFRLLLIDDNPDDRALVVREIRKLMADARIDEAGTAEELDALLPQGDWDVAITDYLLRWSDGLQVFRRLRDRFPDLPVIMFTASGNEEVAVEAMKEGLDDYITKTAKHYGRIPYAIRTCADRMRQRRQTEAALEARRVADRRLQFVFETARIGTWEFLVESGRIRYSDQIGPMFGRERGFTHASIAEWAADIHPDDRDAVLANVDAALRSGSRFRAEYRACGADGVIRWISSEGHAYRNDDRSPDVIGIAVDITERKRMEEELRAADRQKDEFLAMLAHELRNPLAPLTNAHALLRRSPVLTDDERRILGMAERQRQQLARLVDDLLEVSRITTGKIVLRKEPVLIATVVYNAVESVRPMVEKRRQHIEVRVPSDPGRVVVDAARIAQVLGNLLNNASKYTPEGGHIAVEVELTEDEIALCVRDDGVGIPADLLPQLFTLFKQAERTIDRSQGGLGVGLALVKRLVELHGGSVHAESDGIGKGSRFCVRLPRSAGDGAAAQPRDAAETTKAPTKRVLIVDDNRDAADSLAMLLRLEGHAVQVAYDAPAALAAAQTFEPDVAILDLGLPGMDGYALGRALDADPHTRRILLIALSGYGQAADKARSRAAGFLYHLVKPVDAEAIATILAKGAINASDD